jgi:hypothetical protein
MNFCRVLPMGIGLAAAYILPALAQSSASSAIQPTAPARATSEQSAAAGRHTGSDAPVKQKAQGLPPPMSDPHYGANWSKLHDEDGPSK